MRSPKTPLTPTTTTSPSCTTLTNAASIPADPVPLIGSVSALVVRKTARRRSQVSSSTDKNSGSRWPSIGRVIASTTSGYGLHGPGPINTRSDSGIVRSLSTRLVLRQRLGSGGALEVGAVAGRTDVGVGDAAHVGRTADAHQRDH